MRALLLLGGMFALAASQASAADWSFDPRLMLSYLYSDNYQLTDIPGGKVDVSGVELDAQLELRAETPRSRFFLTPRLRSTFFPNDESYEANDGFLFALWRYDAERTMASLRVDYSSMVTFGNYYPTDNVSGDDELGDRDPGIGIGVSERNRQDRILIRPNLTFDLTERQRLGLDLEYLNVTYDTQVTGDREDFQNGLVALGYSYSLSETSSITARAGVSVFDPADDESTQAQGLNIEWRNRISDTAEVYARAGANRVESIRDDGGSAWDTGFAGGSGVRWAFQVTDIWLDVMTNLDPNSSGVIVNRSQARMLITRHLSPRTQVTIGGRIIADSGTGDSKDTFVDRTFATANVGFEWRFARTWALVASYEYMQQEYEDSVARAQANSLRLGIAWQPNRR